jgi:adenylate cyclase
MLKRFARDLSPALLGLFVCAGVCLAVVGLRSLGKLQPLELAIQDRFLGFTASPQSRDPRILLVTISEEDIQSQSTWPLPDATLARLFGSLQKHGPRVIGLDIYRDMPVPPGSDDLKALFATNRNMVTVRKLRDRFSPGVPPPHMVPNADLTGFNDLLVDPDGVARRGLLYIDDGREVFTSFSLLIAQLFLEKDGIFPAADPAHPEWLQLGKSTLVPLEADDGGYVHSDTGGYQILLDFSSGSAGFAWISLRDALDGNFPPEVVRDRIVLIGSWAESTKDVFLVPVELNRNSRKIMSGVELHASIVSQLLRGALEGRGGMAYFSDRLEALWICAWGLVGYVLGVRIRSLGGFMLGNAAAVLTLASLGLVFFLWGAWVPVAPAVGAEVGTATLITAYFAHREKVQRDQLMRLFSCHLSQEVAETLWNQRDQYLEGGRPRAQALTATVVFTDLKGFTSAAENMDATGLMDWLNEYMSAMTRIVMDHGGVVNKYMGDAIMALFGVPAARRTEAEIAGDARNAVECSLAMKREIDRLNRGWAERNRAAMKMRVGIHTGPLMVGCVGSEERLEYTVIGDTVNIASRLESFDKELDAESACRILISEQTLLRLDDGYPVQPLGRSLLKGKGEEMFIYRILDGNEWEEKGNT